ncbi:transcription termination factor NusA [Patescibacteria group bacterium]
MSSPLSQAINQISEEKNIPAESVIETIEAALAAAFRKDFGEKNQNIKVEFDADSGEFDVFDVKTVVEDMELPEEDEEEEGEVKTDTLKKEEDAAESAPSEEGEEEEKKFNPKTEIMVTAAQDLKKGSDIGEEIKTQLDVPAEFGRMAAQTAKQVIIQKLREAERTKVFDEFKGREKELINATVQRREGRVVLIDVGRATAIMPPDEQVQGERYQSGDRIKVFVTDVRMTTKGPEIIVSRSHPEIVHMLFELEIPEIASGVVTIHNVAREAGVRSKASVSSSDDTIDPIGSCIGQRGTRIQTIIAELGGEKIDIIQYDEDAYRYITNALSPAKVLDITLNEAEQVADVLVAADQLSLAIGRGGQNVRLASRLTGWKINIKESGAVAGDLAYDAESDEEAGDDDDGKAADDTEDEEGDDKAEDSVEEKTEETSAEETADEGGEAEIEEK